MPTRPVTKEILKEFAPEVADYLEQDTKFLLAVRTYIFDQTYEDKNRAYVQAWVADQVLRDGGVELTLEQFHADIQSAKEFIESEDFLPYIARYGS